MNTDKHGFMLNQNVTKFKLAVDCPDPEDGTSLMRGIGPLAAMCRQDRRLELSRCLVTPQGAPGYSWDWLVECDALFLQRPYTFEAVACAQTARAFGRPVWVDWDDDLTCVPESNYFHSAHPPERAKKVMALCWALADVVTVSTNHLRERLLELGLGQQLPKSAREQLDAGKVRVIPNACHWPMRNAPRTRRVVWRGGRSHDEDVMAFLPAIAEVARLPQFSQWEWWFVGEMSAYVAAQVKAAIPAPNLRADYKDFIHQYMGALNALAPWLVMVPLADNMFNRSKSNLAWIEATAAGAVTLAPDWEEWRRPGVVNYADRPNFKGYLRWFLETFGEQNVSVHATKSRDYIDEYLLLDKVNENRWEIIESLGAGLAASGKESEAAK